MEPFETIHRAHQERIYNFFLSHVSDRDTAEDLTIELFVRAYRLTKANGLPAERTPEDWLLMLSHQLLAEHR